MRRERARSAGRSLGHRVFVPDHAPACGLDLRAGDVPWAQQHGLAAGAVDDGGLDAHRAFTAVQNHQVRAQFGAHMCRRGGTDPAKSVGTGGCKAWHAPRQTGLQQLLGHRVRGAAQTDRVLPACRCRGHPRQARQNQGERPGPKNVDQRLCKVRHLRRKQRHLGCAGQVHDQRMIGRAALGHKDFGHRRIVGGVGGQAVHRLGGQAHQLAVTQGDSGLVDAGVVCGKRHETFTTRPCPAALPLAKPWRAPPRAWRP